MKPFAFVPPTEPVLAETPPKDKGWCHEVKFDGYWLQLHKAGERALILSKNGKDLTPLFRDVARAVAALPCKSCIIDAEGCALDSAGNPDFRALVGGQKDKVAWCFDLLEVDGRDMRPFPLVTRRVRLEALLKRASSDARLRHDGSDILLTSETFPTRLSCLTPATRAGLRASSRRRRTSPTSAAKTGDG